MSRRRTPLAFRIGASALVLALFLVGAELVARQLGPELPAWRPAEKAGMLMVGHPSRLWGMAPGINTNGQGMATVGAAGLRAPLPERTRPSGRQRILVVGDSSIFGHAVGDAETLPAWLQATLQAQGLDVDVINGGIPGYSSEQSLLLLDEVGWGFEPTLLVLANLWSDNNFDLWHDRDLLHTARQQATNPLLDWAFYRLMAGSIDRLRGGEGARIITWTRQSGAPDDQVRRVPLRDYAANLDAMALQAKERGVGVVFLGLANQDLVSGRYQEGSWDAYFAAQAAVAAHHRSPRVEARGVLAGAVSRGAQLDELFVDELHPSGEGHRLLAAAVARVLAAEGWPQTPLVPEGSGAFDTSALVDDWSEQAEGGYGRDSPQRLLVEDKEADASAGAGDGEVTRAVPTGDWAVGGRVEGPPGPVRIEVQGEGGRVLSTAMLPEPGDFRLRVRSNQDAVMLVATGAGGTRATQSVAKGGPSVSLSLR